MCLALYVATDEPVPTTEWREGESVFGVSSLSEVEEPVRQQFSKPAIAYLNAHTGCSCGFAYGQTEIITPDDHLEEARGRASVEALRAFLAQQVSNGRQVELFACWEGDQGASPQQRLSVTPSSFAGESFELPKKAFYLVCEAAHG